MIIAVLLVLFMSIGIIVLKHRQREIKSTSATNTGVSLMNEVYEGLCKLDNLLYYWLLNDNMVHKLNLVPYYFGPSNLVMLKFLLAVYMQV